VQKLYAKLGLKCVNLPRCCWLAEV
jgi:hypothetical protein